MKKYDHQNPKPDSRALRRLAERLATQPPPTAFHWSQWCAPDATEHSCGSYGCVAGWAATFFPRRLRLARVSRNSPKEGRCVVLASRTRGICGSDPSMEFSEAFGLTHEEGRAITVGRPLHVGSSYLAFIEIGGPLGNNPRVAAKRLLRVLEMAEDRYAARKRQ